MLTCIDSGQREILCKYGQTLSLVRASDEERLICVWSKVFWNDKLITIHYLFAIVVAVAVDSSSRHRSSCMCACSYACGCVRTITKNHNDSKWFTFNREIALQLCGLCVPRVVEIEMRERAERATDARWMHRNRSTKQIIIARRMHSFST